MAGDGGSGECGPGFIRRLLEASSRSVGMYPDPQEQAG